MYNNPDLNSIKETIVFGGTNGAINKPDDASRYFLFISLVTGTASSSANYNSIQLYYDLLNGSLYTRASRDAFTIFDNWYKYNGTVVS